MDLISRNQALIFNRTAPTYSVISRILWLEYWLAQPEASLTSDVELRTGQWTLGTNALTGLYSRLDEITKHSQKAQPITINVVKPEDCLR